MSREWDCFLWPADEWIVNYSLPYDALVSVKLFSIGHAFELYLKAASTKITGDIDHAVGFSHRIPALWADCKKLDPQFLPEFDLRQSVLDLDLLQPIERTQLSDTDFDHYMRHQEIYVVAKYLADLKYLGAPLKKVKGAYAIFSFSHHPKWAELFRAFRKYLGHPSQGKSDVLKFHVESGKLPESSTQFLAGIVSA